MRSTTCGTGAIADVLSCYLEAQRMTRRVAHGRYLFRLIDVQNDNSLQDEELVPILMAAGLDDAAAKAACARLLGGQLTVRPQCLVCCVPACL